MLQINIFWKKIWNQTFPKQKKSMIFSPRKIRLQFTASKLQLRYIHISLHYLSNFRTYCIPSGPLGYIMDIFSPFFFQCNWHDHMSNLTSWSKNSYCYFTNKLFDFFKRGTFICSKWLLNFSSGSWFSFMILTRRPILLYI